MCIAVVRYFGGILLGTGRLTRTYSSAAQCALKSAHRVPLESYTQIFLRVTYPQLGKCETLLAPFCYGPIKKEYGSDVFLSAFVLSAQKDEVSRLLAEMFNGSVCVQEGETHVFPCIADSRHSK